MKHSYEHLAIPMGKQKVEDQGVWYRNPNDLYWSFRLSYNCQLKNMYVHNNILDEDINAQTNTLDDKVNF